MNTEELKDIIECILMFDSTATDMQKARYFDIIQKDLKRVVKLLATPLVSGALPVYPPHFATMVEKIIKKWDENGDVPCSEKVAMKYMALELDREYIICRRQ